MATIDIDKDVYGALQIPGREQQAMKQECRE